MLERRRFVRINDHLSVNCRTNYPSRNVFTSVSHDISERGIGLLLNEDLNSGVILHLEIDIPFEILPVLAKGRVVWVEKITNELGKEAVLKAGIELIEMNEYNASRLKHYIDGRLRDLNNN